MLEIIRNDLCSYSGSDIPRMSYNMTFNPLGRNGGFFKTFYIPPSTCQLLVQLDIDISTRFKVSLFTVYIGVFQANYQDFVFFALSMDFDTLANLLLVAGNSSS